MLKNLSLVILLLVIRMGIAQSSAPEVIHGAKTAYIQNQDYLSTNPLINYSNLYGDSLHGFNEAAVKADLLNRHYLGFEYFLVMNSLKRDFIKKKYGIGSAYTANQSLVPHIAGHPGGGNSTFNAPCVNEDFEATPTGVYSTNNAVSGWTVESGVNPVSLGVACNGAVNWVGGSPEFSIMATPIVGNPTLTPFSIDNVTIPTSPLGGSHVARLQDRNMGNMVTHIKSTFPVTSSNTLFQYAYAGSWDGSGHACCDQPCFAVRLYNCVGDTLTCSTQSLGPAGPSCPSATGNYNITNGISWVNWVVHYIDLSPFIGSCVTVEVINSDCNGGAHHGSVYFDALCGGSFVGGLGLSGNGANLGRPVSFCPGASQAQIAAPLGYSSYQWYAGSPPLPVTGSGMGGNTSVLTVTNPLAGTCYTVQLVTASGCTFTSVDTLQFSSVSIVGLGTSSTCGSGSSGSATVQANGCGTGYNYTWLGPNTSTSSVGTASVVTGLASGVYTVNLSGYGAANCGSAAATVTIGAGPPNIISSVVKPYCGTFAYLSGPTSASNFQWYASTGAIAANLGGTAASYTVNSPTNGGLFWLSCNNQGCKDSILFQLNQSVGGSVHPANISSSCFGLANATANIIVSPAVNSPAGQNSYSVFSTSTPPSPAYTSSLYPATSNTYVPANMPAGSYSVIASDGSCIYTTTFTISDYTYDYQVSPPSATLCAGGSVSASVSFSNSIMPGQYTFHWSPSTFITGGAASGTNQAVSIAPVIPNNSIVTTTYSIAVTPTTNSNCLLTKTISITAVNIQTPSLTAIPNFCNNSTSKTISMTPAGGTFSTGTGSWLGSTGIITPSLTSIGTNTFGYVFNPGNCMASSTGSFSVSQFNSATLTASVLNLCNPTNCTNLMSLVQSTANGAWSGIGVSSNTLCTANLFPSSFVLNYVTPSNPNPNLCPDTQTLNILLGQTPNIQIVPHASFCTDVSPFTMTASPAGGGWSSPIAALISTAGVVNPANAPMGNTAITYTTSAGTCTATATTTINATLFYSAALTGSIGNLCASSPPANLMSIVANTVNGAWSGPNVVNNVFTPPPTSGNYLLYYNTSSAPNPTSCPDMSSIIVHVSAPITPTIISIATQCSSNPPIQLIATPFSGYYTPEPYLSVGGLLTPSLCAVGINTVQYSSGTSTCNVQTTILVTVEAYVPATLTGSLPIQCNTNPIIDLLSLEQYTTGTWSGPGVTGTLFNPAAQGAGTYSLTYSTNSPSGVCFAHSMLVIYVSICEDIWELNASGDALKIYPNPTKADLFIEATGPVKITLYNELGTVMLEGHCEGGSYKIDLTPFKDGLYFIKTNSKEGQSVSKVVKME